MARTAISFARHRQFRASGVEAEAPPGRRSRARGGQLFFLFEHIEAGSWLGRFLYFYIFHFHFLQKYFFYFRNLRKYTPPASLPGGRDLVAPLRGGRGFSAKNFAENLR